MSDDRRGVVLEVHAELDVPGETQRQAHVLVVWAVCLACAVIACVVVGAHVPLSEEGSAWAQNEFSVARARRIEIALVLGLLFPAGFTAFLNMRRRRGGAHARGITVDVTDDGELRVWGRGYGTRVRIEGAVTTERLVDVYAGRLGAWRQRRLRVRSTSGPATGQQGFEIATTATSADADDGLRTEGGEGDCIELAREDFESVRREVFARKQPASPPSNS